MQGQIDIATNVRNLSQGYQRIVEDINEKIDEIDVEVKKEFATELAKALRQELRVYIDKPRPETVAAIKPALSGQFGVRIQGQALEWLTLIIEGYTEVDSFIPVLRNVELDFYGNEPRGQFRRLLFDTDTFYLPTPRNGLERGIYRRYGNNSLRKLYSQVTQRRDSILPYEDLVNKHVAKILANNVEEIFDKEFDKIKNEVFITNLDIEL